mmetsp:Transcript_3857/g.5888  ORF Transcript_3857/g.5888 Transcript_3857/m.5888 type:complete len:106 (-) Transcript_3857:10749-11066(-)
MIGSWVSARVANTDSGFVAEIIAVLLLLGGFSAAGDEAWWCALVVCAVAEVVSVVEARLGFALAAGVDGDSTRVVAVRFVARLRRAEGVRERPRSVGAGDPSGSA